MPELAEVEYYRKQWNCGLDQAITGIALHTGKRLFRGVSVPDLVQWMPGSSLVRSEARGKQLLFEFSKDLWLGLHLGMTGKLLAGPPNLQPGKHDHLVLYQKTRSLVFHDPRVFGRVHFARQTCIPDWWAKLPAPVDSRAFTRAAMESFLLRHRRLPIKAALLLQSGFPGIGNWMADEILWRAKISPTAPVGKVLEKQSTPLWKSLRFVCRAALKRVGHDFSDPPRGWLFHERWGRGGQCPIHRQPLARQTIGGRTTAWCLECQP